MCLYYVLHVITLLEIFVIETYINLEKKFSFKKNRKASEHAQRVCKDARGVMKIMTLNQKKPRDMMKNHLFSNHRKNLGV